MPTFIQPSFAKGELAPALYGRVDTAAYQVGLRTARNASISPYGGVFNRAGTEFVGPVKTHTVSPRLLDFEFKTTDKYTLEFGNLYMRVIRDGAHVLEDSVAITGVTAANPGVVTAVAHGYSNGDDVYITGIVGMTRLNGRFFRVGGVTANTFTLLDQVTGNNINTTSFTAWSSGGTVARLYTVTTPYVTADLDELKWTQSADVMTITHPSYEIRELTRTDHDAWAFTIPTFAPGITAPTTLAMTVDGANNGVTYRYQVTAIAETTQEESLPALNTTTRTITGVTAANPAVVTSAAHGFSNGDEVAISGIVGMTELNNRRFFIQNVAANTFELEDENSTAYTAYSSGGSANQTFVRTTVGTTNPDNTITWAEVSTAQKYAVYREKNGMFGLIGETELLTFKDSNITPDLDVGPPKARNPFRVAGSYPGSVSYFEQRRVFGGSTDDPDTSYYSQTGNQSNFSISSPLQDDDAITATLNARQVNEIRHFVPGNDLLILTSGAEWRVNAGGDVGFAATTMRQKPQSFWGSNHLQPIVVGNTTLFCQENSSNVRSLGYSLQIDGYTGNDMNTLASHIFETYTLEDWAFAHSPNSIIHGIRSDGKALSLTFNQEQEVIAWAQWDTQGKFERVQSERHSADTVDDEVYFVVKRNRPDGTVIRYIEKLHSRRFTDVRDCFFVDCGLSLDEPVTISAATAANPVVVTATSHGFSNGDEVDIFDIVWVADEDEFGNETQPDQLNTRRFTVASATANTFALTGEDGSAFNAYVEGGTVRKAVATVTGLDHLEGQTVVALCDGNVNTALTVTNGAITFARKYSRIHVGLRYISDVELLNIEAPQGTIQGKKIRIPSVTVRFERSRLPFIGPRSDNMEEMKQRENEAMGDPTELLTGDKAIDLPTDWHSEGRIFMRQMNPVPMTILAVIPEVELED